MSTSGEPAQDVLLQDILQYLKSHPQAKDSLEGIAEWWLSPPLRHGDHEEIRKALDLLMARGEVIRVNLGNGQIVYHGLEHASGKHRTIKP
jgi:hypothetical protein